jgi:predicted porin
MLSTTLPGVNTKVSGLYSRDESTTVKADAWSVYAVQPVGKIDLKAAYGHKNVDDTTSYTVAVAYNLSKRTSLEAALLKVTATTAANESRVAGVGINHTF